MIGFVLVRFLVLMVSVLFCGNQFASIVSKTLICFFARLFFSFPLKNNSIIIIDLQIAAFRIGDVAVNSDFPPR